MPWIQCNFILSDTFCLRYGSSETCAGCVYQRVGVSPPGSIGYLIANTELMLMDENGNGMFKWDKDYAVI